MTVSMSNIPRLSGEEVRAELALHAKQFDREHRKTGGIVDIEVFAHDGAVVLPGGTYDELVVPDHAGSIIINGDLEILGVLEQPFRSCPVIIQGNLTAGHVVTTGYLVVMGDAKIRGTFYGNCTNYDTVVYGTLTANTIILEKNHHFSVHGKVSSKVMLDDEEDGYDATRAWMEKQGVADHDEAALANVLRSRPTDVESAPTPTVKMAAPAKKVPAKATAKKPAAKKATAKKATAKKPTAKKPTAKKPAAKKATAKKPAKKQGSKKSAKKPKR